MLGQRLRHPFVFGSTHVGLVVKNQPVALQSYGVFYRHLYQIPPVEKVGQALHKSVAAHNRQPGTR